MTLEIDLCSPPVPFRVPSSQSLRNVTADSIPFNAIWPPGKERSSFLVIAIVPSRLSPDTAAAPLRGEILRSFYFPALRLNRLNLTTGSSWSFPSPGLVDGGRFVGTTRPRQRYILLLNSHWADFLEGCSQVLILWGLTNIINKIIYSYCIFVELY